MGGSPARLLAGGSVIDTDVHKAFLRALMASQPKSQSTTPEIPDPEVLIVDWDGPDDPQNPKKYLSLRHSCPAQQFS
jgi:hypothetical protein